MPQELPDDEGWAEPAGAELTTVGARIKRAARFRAMTLKELAETAEVPYSTLMAYLSDKHAMPATVLMKIGRALSMDLNWIAFGPAFVLKVRALKAAAIRTKKLIEDGFDIRDELSAIGSMYSVELDTLVSGRPRPVPPRFRRKNRTGDDRRNSEVGETPES